MRSRSLIAAFSVALVFSCSSVSRPPPAAPPPPPAASAAPAPPHEKSSGEAFLDACHLEIDTAKGLLAQILSVKDARTVDNTLEPYNQLWVHVRNVEDKSSLFSEVHPDKGFRDSAEQCVKDVSSFETDLGLNQDLYKSIGAVDVSTADADTKRFVAHTLRDFRRSGVDKDEPTRKKLKQLQDDMTATGLEFDKNIREDVRSVKLDPAQLKGMPDDFVKAHPPGADGKVVVTTDYPDYLPFKNYDEDPAARKALYLEFQNRGWPKNDEMLKKLLVERREFATTLGYASYADYITEDKMIKSSKNAQDFIDRITKLADKRAKKDYADLLKRKKKDDPNAKSVEEWEKGLYEQKVKREQYAFDSQSVRPYFEYTETKKGLLAVTAQMYGVEYKPVADAPKWDTSVDVYDVTKDGQKIGRIYLDLHPRDGKFKHAANFSVVHGVKGVQLPEAALICNFPDPAKGEALMDHDDVVTMFHEFGHLMHSIFAGQQHWAMFSGTATEWDFVEAPSQMFEEWAWAPAVLATFAKHKDNHQPIPADVVKRMRHANEFAKGSGARQQMLYAELSLRLHMEKDPAKLDTTEIVKDVQARYGMFPYVEGSHFQANFGHLNGYSAIYYTYMWSLVIAKDLLTEFQVKGKGLMDPAIDKKWREEVLAKGGSEDAAVLVHRFLGRDSDFKSYEAWLNRD